MDLCRLKKVIVTGATGFLGLHLIDQLVKDNVEVTAICRPYSKNKFRLVDYDRVSVIEFDLDEITNLPIHISDRDYDVFFHLGWEGASGLLRTDCYTQQKNTIHCCNAAQVAKELGCKKIVATGTVYEKLYNTIIHSDVFRAPAFYLLSKKYAYEMMLQLTKKIDLDFVWCTFFQPIGKYIKPEQMMAYTISSLLKNKQPIFGQALEPYDIVAVEDIAHGIILAGKTELSQKQYYIGSGAPKRLFEYLEIVQQLINPTIPLGVGLRPDDGLRFNYEWLECSQFMYETGYRPRVSFNDAVLRTAEWIISNEGE